MHSNDEWIVHTTLIHDMCFCDVLVEVCDASAGV
jgi:hypothetical protein